MTPPWRMRVAAHRTAVPRLFPRSRAYPLALLLIDASMLVVSSREQSRAPVMPAVLLLVLRTCCYRRLHAG